MASANYFMLNVMHRFVCGIICVTLRLILRIPVTVIPSLCDQPAFPKVRILAEELGVTPSTVMGLYKTLHHQGHVWCCCNSTHHVWHGRTILALKEDTMYRAAECGTETIIDASGNNRLIVSHLSCI
ncbi:hypothetical protein BDR04DRAFT_1097911 [Suillus decipiens]|nr:hypothetical protein BDR04DRAFT_1097911 [Suillus decipiens]